MKLKGWILLGALTTGFFVVHARGADPVPSSPFAQAPVPGKRPPIPGDLGGAPVEPLWRNLDDEYAETNPAFQTDGKASPKFRGRMRSRGGYLGRGGYGGGYGGRGRGGRGGW